MALRSPRFNRNNQLLRSADNNPPLKIGAQGEGVRLIQQALMDLGATLPVSTRRYGSPDGMYGTETAGRVKAFQSRHRLSPDGRVGRNTLAKLDELLPGAGQPLPPLPATSRWTHRVKLHFRSIGHPRVPEMTAFNNAQRVYAQYGIRFEFASGETILLDDEDSLRFNVIDGECLWNQLSDEQQALHDLGGRGGVGADDILVYYVNEIREDDGGTLAGCAGHDPSNPAVVVSAVGSQWTLAHEICHVMLGSSFRPVHSTDSKNLMFTPTANITQNPPELTVDQLRAIKASPCCRSL